MRVGTPTCMRCPLQRDGQWNIVFKFAEGIMKIAPAKFKRKLYVLEERQEAKT